MIARMHLLVCTLTALAIAVPAWGTGAVAQPPAYTAAGIVNAASYSADALAPNTIAALFGTNLSYDIRSVSGAGATYLPTSMGGVTVYIGGVAAGLFYVSPNQINFLVPNNISAGTYAVDVIRQSLAGPEVSVTFHETGPGLFQDAAKNAVATHLDGSLINDASPAAHSEWIVVYCDGLGRTVPDAITNAFPTGAASIQHFAELQVLLDGNAVDPSLIYYAGLTPGYAGLYQINVKMPESITASPEIRVAIGSQMSIAGVHLAVR